MTGEDYEHGDVRNGFVLRFRKKPELDLPLLSNQMKELIKNDLPVSYVDENHIYIGDYLHYCTGPRIHVRSTGEIEVFNLLERILHDTHDDNYLVVGLVGKRGQTIDEDLNRIVF